MASFGIIFHHHNDIEAPIITRYHGGMGGTNTQSRAHAIRGAKQINGAIKGERSLPYFQIRGVCLQRGETEENAGRGQGPHFMQNQNKSAFCKILSCQSIIHHWPYLPTCAGAYWANKSSKRNVTPLSLPFPRNCRCL